MSDDSCDWEEAHGVACGVLVKARAEVERLRAEVQYWKERSLQPSDYPASQKSRRAMEEK